MQTKSPTVYVRFAFYVIYHGVQATQIIINKISFRNKLHLTIKVDLGVVQGVYTSRRYFVFLF